MIHPPPQVWDRGLQNERTRLAWQRTVLALVGCGLVVARLVALHWWPAGVALALLAALAGLWLGRRVTLRYRRNQGALWRRSPLADGRAQAGVLALLLLVGVGAGWYLATVG